MTEGEPVPFLTDPAGREHLLENAITTVGRSVESSIVITSKRVSREHACIRREGRHVTLEDRGSTNGTFLNDERVLSPVELRDGDRITIGDVTFVFHDPDMTFRDRPFPELEVDLAAGVVRANRRILALSPKEYALLAFLYQRRGQVCSKDDIATTVWAEYQDGIYDYQVENLVRRLRSKFEVDPSDPQVLLTVRGQGYRLVVRE